MSRRRAGGPRPAPPATRRDGGGAVRLVLQLVSRWCRPWPPRGRTPDHEPTGSGSPVPSRGCAAAPAAGWRERRGPAVTASAGSSRKMAVSVSAGVVPLNARRPVSISYSTAPRENRSDRWSATGPAPARATCSRAFPAPCLVSCSAVSPPRCRPLILGPPELRHAEVEDLHQPVTGEEQVLGLEVAVHDAAVVRRRQPPRDLDRVVDRPSRTEWRRRQPFPQRLALAAARRRCTASCRSRRCRRRR